MRGSCRSVIGVVAALLLPSPALALGVSTPIPGEERFAGMQAQDATKLGAGFGIGQIDEDWALTITPRLELSFGKIGLGLQVPIRLIVDDNPPDNDGLLREKDWDEVQDYFKFIRYFQYGHKGDFFYTRVGELAARLGHGTVVDRYMNNIDIDTFRTGVQLDLNTTYGGFESLLGDVGNLFVTSQDSKLVGLRAYINPVALADPESVFNIFSVGGSFVIDATAPTVLAIDPATGRMQVDAENNPKVAEASGAAIYGFDADAKVLDNDLIKLTPYTDLNFIQLAGFGWHLGAFLTLSLPIGFDLQIPMRLEYRLLRDDYIPTYFSTFYEFERYRFPLAPRALPGDSRYDGLPKLRWARRQHGTTMISGYYGDLAFDFAGLVQIGGLLEGYGGVDPTLSLFLSLPAIDVVKFKAYYERAGVKSGADIFGLDERSMLTAQLAINPWGPLYVVGRWTRQWTLQDDPATPEPEYEPTDSWDVGLDLVFEL